MTRNLIMSNAEASLAARGRKTEVPAEVTLAFGLTSWPERGSANAPLIDVWWAYSQTRITYEEQDGLWLVTGRNPGSNGGCAESDLFARADLAWESAQELRAINCPASKLESWDAPRFRYEEPAI